MIHTDFLKQSVILGSNDDCYGYKHYTKEGKCFYVGIGNRRRPYDFYNRNHKWKAIVQRFGVEVVICIGPTTRDNVIAWEIQAIFDEKTYSDIHDHDSSDVGCNFSIGGEINRGFRFSEEAKKRLSQRMKNHTVSNETRQKISAGLTGVKRSEATKEKQSLAHRGHHHNDESKQKISDALTGRSMSDDVKEKLHKANQSIWTEQKRSEHRELMKNKTQRSQSGKTISEETKDKMRLAQQIRRCREKDLIVNDCNTIK